MNNNNLYQKACSAAVSLIDTTGTFLKVQTSLQTSISNNNTPQIQSELQKLIDNYEQVYLIVNVIRSVKDFLEDDIQKSSLMNAANSASSSTFSGLLKVYEELHTNQDERISDLVHDRVVHLLKQNENFSQERLEIASASSEEDSIQDGAMKEDQLMLEAPAVPMPTERSRPAGQHQEPTRHISTMQFLMGFENTATEFANKSRMQIDSFWESMFIYAVPPNRADWVKQNMFGKNLSWKDAKSLYSSQYPDANAFSVSPPMPTRQNAAKNSTPPAQEADRHRISEYGERLLSLEMSRSEDIEAYNAKYLRYCTAAQIDLNDPSLKRRYLMSLLPEYRHMLPSKALQQQGLKQVMQFASNTIKEIEGPKPMTRIKPFNEHSGHAPQQLPVYSNNSSEKQLKRIYPFNVDNTPNKRAAPY